jgi:hypothetical protein
MRARRAGTEETTGKQAPRGAFDVRSQCERFSLTVRCQCATVRRYCPAIRRATAVATTQRALQDPTRARTSSAKATTPLAGRSGDAMQRDDAQGDAQGDAQDEPTRPDATASPSPGAPDDGAHAGESGGPGVDLTAPVQERSGPVAWASVDIIGDATSGGIWSETLGALQVLPSQLTGALQVLPSELPGEPQVLPFGVAFLCPVGPHLLYVEAILTSVEGWPLCPDHYVQLTPYVARQPSS